MSGNPNPTVCGNCHTENPPGAEYCRECGEPLTLPAEQALDEGDAVERQDPLLDTTSPADSDVGTVPRTDPLKDRFPTD